MKSIIIFIDYFGKWPPWIFFFLESCRANPTVHWCIHSDCGPIDTPVNVHIIHMSFVKYCQKISDILKVKFKPKNAYNICNIKPMVGVLHSTYLEGYDFFGWGDIDVIYGNIRGIYSDKVLHNNVISSHRGICSGHFLLMKNREWLRNAFRLLHNWEKRLEDPGPFLWDDSLDEASLSALFSPQRRTREHFASRCGSYAPSAKYYRNNQFVEQWSTPFTPTLWRDGNMRHPEKWFWNKGKLTNDIDGSHEFLYLHLMNLKSPRWVDSAYADAPTWDRLADRAHFDAEGYSSRDANDRRVQIDRFGIHEIDCL